MIVEKTIEDGQTLKGWHDEELQSHLSQQSKNLYH
jgi:hypothetical protein